jgi:hypothetical protein
MPVTALTGHFLSNIALLREIGASQAREFAPPSWPVARALATTVALFASTIVVSGTGSSCPP